MSSLRTISPSARSLEKETKEARKAAEKLASAEAKRQAHIATLEKYAGKYERAIKRNEKALKKTFIYDTTGTAEPPADATKIWMRDLILLGRREYATESIPRHKKNLETLLEDIKKLKEGLPESEISEMSRGTLYENLCFGTANVQTHLLSGCGLGL
jgi:hypothetical protein